MDDEPHVRAVDAHAERGRRDDEVAAAREEPVLGGAALRGGQPCVVDVGGPVLREQRREAFALRAGPAVDDDGTGLVGHRLADVRVPVVLRGGRAGAEPDVRAVGVVDEHARVAHPQPADDLGAHVRRRGRGEREQPRLAQARDGPPDEQVVRPEVVAPLGDAVRLVDDDEPHVGRRQCLDDDLALELLRAEQQHVEAAPGRRGERPALLARRPGRADRRHPQAALGERALLVTLQGDERGDDDGQPRRDDRRDRVDRGLAGPGAGDEHGVVVGQAGERVALRLPQLDPLAQHPGDGVLEGGRGHGTVLHVPCAPRPSGAGRHQPPPPPPPTPPPDEPPLKPESPDEPGVGAVMAVVATLSKRSSAPTNPVAQ